MPEKRRQTDSGKYYINLSSGYEIVFVKKEKNGQSPDWDKSVRAFNEISIFPRIILKKNSRYDMKPAAIIFGCGLH
jgi:hypothetical protein